VADPDWLAAGRVGSTTLEQEEMTMPGLTETDLDEIFTYHKPDEVQAAKYVALRTKAKELALLILTNVPASAEQTTAIRHVQEAVMFANAGIAIHHG
jgi:hypothetical protein